MGSLLISPLSWAALLKKTGRELLLFAGLGGLFAVAAFFEPFNNEKPYTGQTPDQVVRDHLTMPERLGYAILLRSGYAQVQLYDEGEGTAISLSEQKNRQNIALHLSIASSHPELVCLRPDYTVAVADIGGIDIHNLTIAILAAEKYNRSAFERRIEFGLADILLRLTGRLPNFSYGLAQLRPEIARQVLRNELGDALSDRDLLALLDNPCQNARLASQYLEILVKQAGAAKTLEALIAQVARTYNGAVTPTIQGLRYADAVFGAYGLIPSDYVGDPAPSVAADVDIHCLTYEPGAVAFSDATMLKSAMLGSGDAAESEQDKSAPVSKKPVVPPAERDIQLKFSTTDPGPGAYTELLAQRRKLWLVEQLTALGYNRQRISIADIRPEESLSAACGDSESKSDLEPSVEIDVSKPVSEAAAE